MEDYLTCPITNCLFTDPVMAEDGHTYERQAIESWFKKNTSSPITRKTIGKNLFPNYSMKNIIDIYLKDNPDSVNDKYKIIETFDIFHLRDLVEVNDHKNIIDYLEKYKLDAQNKILPWNKKYVHLYWIYGTNRDRKNLIKSGINMHELTPDKNTLLHIAAFNGSKKSIMMLLKIGLDPLAVNCENKKPIDIAHKYKNKIAIEILSKFTPRPNKINRLIGNFSRSDIITMCTSFTIAFVYIYALTNNMQL